jgi:hypothetical protein
MAGVMLLSLLQSSSAHAAIDLQQFAMVVVR